MRKFEYLQVDYINYPSPSELNEEGIDGWELILISPIEKAYYDTYLKSYLTKKQYIATFKREIT